MGLYANSPMVAEYLQERLEGKKCRDRSTGIPQAMHMHIHRAVPTLRNENSISTSGKEFFNNFYKQNTKVKHPITNSKNGAISPEKMNEGNLISEENMQRYNLKRKETDRDCERIHTWLAGAVRVDEDALNTLLKNIPETKNQCDKLVASAKEGKGRQRSINSVSDAIRVFHQMQVNEFTDEIPSLHHPNAKSE
jgi:hypothetical protein